MARLPQLIRFARKHKLKICTIQVAHQVRRSREKLVERMEMVKMEAITANLICICIARSWTGRIIWRWCAGTWRSKESVGARPQRMPTGDVFGSRRCDFGPQLHQAMRMVAESGRGVVVYMRQEGRGIGLAPDQNTNYERGYDFVEANKKLGYRHGPARIRPPARKSSRTWASISGCLRTIPRRWWGWKVTEWRLWSKCRSRSGRIRATRNT